MTNQAILDVCSAQTVDVLLTKVRAGFELETQSTDEKEWPDLRDELASVFRKSGIDTVRYSEAIRTGAEELASSKEDMLRASIDIWGWSILPGDALYSDYPQFSSTIQLLRQHTPDPDAFAELGIDLAAMYFAQYSPDSWATQAVRIITQTDSDWHVDRANYVNPDLRGLSSGQQRAGALFNFAPGFKVLEVGEDGSVGGAEIRTVGGLTSEEFKSAAELAFSVDHYIDKQCSFHVHLSVPGVEHSHSPRLQRDMLEYLLINRDLLPRSVLRRFSDRDWVSRYYAPKLDDDKYRCVAFRGNTWEFRGFGNVQSPEDGQVCLELAARALQHAYRVKVGQADCLMPDLGDNEFADFFMEQMSGVTQIRQANDVVFAELVGRREAPDDEGLGWIICNSLTSGS